MSECINDGCSNETVFVKYCSTICELQDVKRQLEEAKQMQNPLKMIARRKYAGGVITEIYERKEQHARRRASELRRIGHKIVDVHRIGKFKMKNGKWMDASMVVYSVDPDEELLSVENSQSG